MIFNCSIQTEQQRANVTSFTSSGNLTHGVVVCSSVNGSFVAGETITGGSSSNSMLFNQMQLV